MCSFKAVQKSVSKCFFKVFVNVLFQVLCQCAWASVIHTLYFPVYTHMIVDVIMLMYMQDLSGLRAIENDLRGAMAKTVDPCEKDKIQGHIVLIESKKSELKKQSRPL